MEKKLILVTGGAGFIGSHLCERLAKDGHRVVSLDNYFTGSRDNHVPGVEYREGHTKDIAALIPETPDLVYHLGEYSRVAESIHEPETVWDLNLRGTTAVLDFCRKRGAKLIYAGSSTKFSDPREDGTPGPHLSPYTFAKAMMSDLSLDYRRWYDLPVTVVYFYNVYGPRELSGKYGTVVEIYRQAYLAGEPLKVNSPGTQKRTYTHVSDIVNALILIAEKGTESEYGIGAAESYSTSELAELFHADIEMMPARTTSRPSTPLDTAALTALGWKQEHTLMDYVGTFLTEHPRS